MTHVIEVLNVMSIHGNASLCPRQWLCPFSICFLDVYLCLSRRRTLNQTSRRQPLWTSVQISESMHFWTHVYWSFFLLLVGTTTSQSIRHILALIYIGGEDWLGFPDLWSGQKSWWNWCLTPVANFGEVRRAQLVKSTLLTPSLVPLGFFQIF